MKKITIILIATVVFIALLTSQLTLFVIQPIGALPEGKTLVMTRLNKTQFIDSADAICDRKHGGVSLFCRMGTLAGVLTNATILIRLPYSSWLYEISTGEKSYEK